MEDLTFFRAHARLLGAGALLTFSSIFGQTYFIALFAGHYRSEFGLSHGDYGALYMIGTLASALTIIYAGTLADEINPRTLGSLVLAGLGTVCLFMAITPNWLVLLFVFYGLRLFGQGMTTHVGLTAIAKWFDAHRGRAISLASLGHPVSESFLPFACVMLIALVGWRSTWVIAAVFLFLVMIPVFWWLMQGAPTSAVEKAAQRSGGSDDRHQWSRREVLRDPLFYALQLGFLAPAFISTGIFFHQIHIVEIKNWSVLQFAAAFPALAIASVLSVVVSGWVCDKWGPRRFLPLYLVPLCLSALCLAFGQAAIWIAAFMLFIGVTTGFSPAFQGVLFAELYGRQHLGSIRALVMACMVFSSAISPFVMGALIDAGVEIQTQLLCMAGYCLASVPFYLSLGPVLKRRDVQ